jgi:hypothetical protein
MVSAETFSREIPLLDPWYVTGFTEGEGSFTFSRSGQSMTLYFAIKLTMVDRHLLEAIQHYFGGIGMIYHVKARAPAGPGSGFTKSAAYFRASRREDLHRVVEHFDNYPLRGSKALSYAIWREMFVLKSAFRKVSNLELEALAARLSAASPRNARWE